jgi:hypothetical protein
MLTAMTTEYLETHCRPWRMGHSNSWTVRGVNYAQDSIGEDTSGELCVAMHFTGREPSISELLDDPIARLLMASDRLSPETVWKCVRDARRKLKEPVAKSRQHRVASVTDR